MRAVLAAVVVLVSIAPLAATGCADEGDTTPDPNTQIPASCPSKDVEVCGYRDGGFTVDCEYGNVQVFDLTQTMYCDPPKTEVVCESELKGPQIIYTCSAMCSDEVKYFDTFDEYSAFDPASLCL
jgi:hypothetical protein